MHWYSPLVVIAFFWANAALANVWPANPLPTAAVSHFAPLTANVFVEQHNGAKTVRHPNYKQVKYSKKLSRYLWLQNKKPQVFSDYNKLNRIIFSQNLLPVSFIKDIFHVSSIEHDVSSRLNLHALQVWMQNPPDCAHRLSGWKESNILYTGSLTYHCASIPI